MGILAAMLFAGCLPPLHTAPPAGAPAGTLKFRIQHFHNPGGTQEFHLLIDDKSLPHAAIPAGPSATWTRAVPGWRRVDFGSGYFVVYSTTYQTTAQESYPCGKSTCYRTVYRTVTQWHRRYLGRCSKAMAVYLEDRHTYLFGYSYLGDGSCTLTCHRQVFVEGARFQLEPCPLAQLVRQ